MSRVCICARLSMCATFLMNARSTYYGNQFSDATGCPTMTIEEIVINNKTVSHARPARTRGPARARSGTRGPAHARASCARAVLRARGPARAVLRAHARSCTRGRRRSCIRARGPSRAVLRAHARPVRAICSSSPSVHACALPAGSSLAQSPPLPHPHVQEHVAAELRACFQHGGHRLITAFLTVPAIEGRGSGRLGVMILPVRPLSLHLFLL
jgi:hypothetical protein